jgi:hypothetical protein
MEGAMTMQEPPELHALEGVIPVVQTQTRGEWAVTLVSLERWDRGFVANVDIHHDTDSLPPSPASPGDAPERLHPHLVLEAADDRGGRYQGWFGGDFGGSHHGRSRRRFVRVFTPPLDPAATGLRLAAHLQLQRQDPVQRRMVVVRSVPGPWTFTVSLGPAG